MKKLLLTGMFLIQLSAFAEFFDPNDAINIMQETGLSLQNIEEITAALLQCETFEKVIIKSLNNPAVEKQLENIRICIDAIKSITPSTQQNNNLGASIKLKEELQKYEEEYKTLILKHLKPNAFLKDLMPPAVQEYIPTEIKVEEYCSDCTAIRSIVNTKNAEQTILLHKAIELATANVMNTLGMLEKPSKQQSRVARKPKKMM